MFSHILRLQNIDLYKKIISSIASRLLSLAISFVGSVILTRAIGIEGRGIIAWSLSMAAIVSAISLFGMDNVNKRIISEDGSRTKDMILLSVILVILSSLVLIPLFYHYGSLSELGQKYNTVLLLSLMISPFITISRSLGEAFVALQEARNFNIVLLIQKVTNAILIVLLVVFGVINPLLAVIALFISFAIQTSIIFFLLRKRISFHLHGIIDVISHMKIFILLNYLFSTFMALSASMIVIFLSHKSQIKETGLYSTSTILIDAFVSMFVIIGFYAMPQLLKTEGRKEKMKLKINIILVTLFLSFSVAATLFFSANWLIPLIFGKQFIDAIPVFKILTSSIIFMSLFSVLQSTIQSETKGWLITLSPAIMLVFVVILSYLFIGPYGAIGGAVARVVSVFIAMMTAIFVNIFLHKASSKA